MSGHPQAMSSACLDQPCIAPRPAAPGEPGSATRPELRSRRSAAPWWPRPERGSPSRTGHEAARAHPERRRPPCAALGLDPLLEVRPQLVGVLRRRHCLCDQRHDMLDERVAAALNLGLLCHRPSPSTEASNLHLGFVCHIPSLPRTLTVPCCHCTRDLRARQAVGCQEVSAWNGAAPVTRWEGRRLLRPKVQFRRSIWLTRRGALGSGVEQVEPSELDTLQDARRLSRPRRRTAPLTPPG